MLEALRAMLVRVKHALPTAAREAADATLAHILSIAANSTGSLRGLQPSVGIETDKRVGKSSTCGEERRGEDWWWAGLCSATPLVMKQPQIQQVVVAKCIIAHVI